MQNLVPTPRIKDNMKEIFLRRLPDRQISGKNSAEVNKVAMKYF